LAIVLAPPFLTVSLLHGCFGASLFDCTPVINDEIAFWHEIATFRVAGFNGGYHTTNELMAPARFCRFDPKGPGYPVLYGTLALALGWERWSAPLFHFLCVAAAAGLWMWSCRPDSRQLAVVAFLVATWWPGLLWIPSTMPEGLHLAFAFLIAAVVHRAFSSSPITPAGFVIPALVIGACAIVRLTWGLLLLPWAVLSLKGVSLRGRVLGTLLVGGLLLVLFLESRWCNGPHPLPEGIGIVAWLLGEARTSPANAWSFFIGHAGWNLRNLTYRDGGQPLEMLQRYMLLAALLVTAVALWRAWRSRSRDSDVARRWWFVALNLAPLTVAMILVYDVAEWRDYRVVAPHLLLSFLVLAGGAAWRWVVGVCCLQLMFLPAFVTQYKTLHRERVSWDRELVSAFAAEIRESGIHYDPGRSPWDNTILVSGDLVTYPLLALPPAMGVNAVLVPDTLVLPPRSRYVLMTEEDTRDLHRVIRLKLLARTRMGVLSINLDASLRRDRN
jgi:hypothetical protein